MRDFVSCFSENAVSISHPSCSSPSAAAASLPSAAVQTAVTSLYAAEQNPLLISVTWTKSHSSQTLSINFTQSPATTAATTTTANAAAFKLDTTARFFKKNKGTKSYDLNSHKIEIHWDFSAAVYEGGGPEPTSGFHVAVTVDSEVGLILGETPKSGEPKWTLMSRTEHWCGNTLFSTRARFSEGGVCHEILIRCGGEESEEAAEERGKGGRGLCVWIDKKAVIRVKRLRWNFRGNQSVFVDGFLVDLLWDVHDWVFGSRVNGFAVFMFRRRSGLETSRLWLDDHKSNHVVTHMQNCFDFSFLIYASKTL